MENTALNGTTTVTKNQEWKTKKGYGPIIVAVSLALLLGLSFYAGCHSRRHKLSAKKTAGAVVNSSDHGNRCPGFDTETDCGGSCPCPSGQVMCNHPFPIPGYYCHEPDTPQCAGNYGSQNPCCDRTSVDPCCDQVGSISLVLHSSSFPWKLGREITPILTNDDAISVVPSYQCPQSKPTCVNYVYNHHWGTCE